MDREDGSVQGVIELGLTLIFACGAYAYFVNPIYNPIANAITTYFTTAAITPGVQFQNMASFLAVALSGRTIALLSMLLAFISLLIIELRSAGSVN